MQWQDFEKILISFFSFFMRKFKHKEENNMFSDELTERIYMDERLDNIPFDYKSSVLRAVQDAIESRVLENPDMSREEILNDICNRD